MKNDLREKLLNIIHYAPNTRERDVELMIDYEILPIIKQDYIKKSTLPTVEEILNMMPQYCTGNALAQALHARIIQESTQTQGDSGPESGVTTRNRKEERG